MPTTLKMQNIFSCETNEKQDKKKKNLSVHNYSPPPKSILNIIIVEAPFAAIQLQVSWGMSLQAWHILPLGFLPIHQGKTAPAPSSWMGSAGVQQSFSHTTDCQLD